MSEPRIRKAREMAQSEPTSWRLSPGCLAGGKVNFLVGAEGIGKSLWTIRAIASVTTGQPWGPFSIESEPADAVLIATEDGFTDTIRPRLEVVGADLDRVHLVCEDEDGTGTPVFESDLGVLENWAITPALVVADAWIDTVPPRIKMKDSQQARQAVRPWKNYATRTGAAVGP